MKNRSMKNKAKEKMRRIAIQILLNVAIIALIFLILNINLPISPKDNIHTRNSTTEFEWIGLTSKAVIDDNPQFTSPIEITKENPLAELKPGAYYWKVGLSRTHRFVIDSEVSIAVTPATIENETTYRIENQGNTRMLVNIIGLITGKAIALEPNAVTYEKNVSDIEKIITTQND